MKTKVKPGKPSAGKKTTDRRTYIAKSPNGLEVVSVYKKLGPSGKGGYYIIRSDGVVKFVVLGLGEGSMNALFSKHEVVSGKSEDMTKAHWTTRKLGQRAAAKIVQQSPKWDRDDPLG